MDKLTDKLLHRLFGEIMKMNFIRGNTGVPCSACENALEAYYCEERLYLVRCPVCEVASLVKACSPAEAAHKARAFEKEV